MILKHRSAVSSVPPEVARAAGWRSGLVTLLLVAIGTLLLTFAASTLLAAATVGGGIDPLRGTDGGERLAGLGGNENIRGLDGDDELDGGGCRDLLLGGPRDDFIEAKDGEADPVACGPGNDVASVDSADYVEGDCETLYPG